MSKTAFIGHRRILTDALGERLTAAIKKEIESGCLSFTMGTHGDFDALALKTCKKLKSEYPNIDVEVIITSLNALKPNDNARYADVKTTMFDIEEMHFKQRISQSNRKMIDGCDTLICYVDEKISKSGAKTVLNYARRRGLKIVNLFIEQDRPFYNMSREEIENYRKAFLSRQTDKTEL